MLLKITCSRILEHQRIVKIDYHDSKQYDETNWIHYWTIINESKKDPKVWHGYFVIFYEPLTLLCPYYVLIMYVLWRMSSYMFLISMNSTYFFMRMTSQLHIYFSPLFRNILIWRRKSRALLVQSRNNLYTWSLESINLNSAWDTID